MSECGQDVNVELQDLITNPFPTLPAIPPSTGVGEVIDVDDWPETGLIGITPGIQVPTLSSYNPQIGDLAYLIKQGSQWIAIGSLSTRGIGGALPEDGISADGRSARWSFEDGAPNSAVGGGWAFTPSPTSLATVDALLYASETVNRDNVPPVPHGFQVAKYEWNITNGGTPPQAAVAFLTAPTVPAGAGEQWTASAKIKCIVSQGLAQSNLSLSINGFAVSLYAFGVTGASDWIAVQTPPTTLDTANVVLTFQMNNLRSDVDRSAFGEWLFDDVQLKRVS